MQNQNKKTFFLKKFRNSIITKLTAYVVIFTISLIIILFNYLNQPYLEEGILEAQEAYLYANMVESWGSPPNIDLAKEDSENMSLKCAIFILENDWSDDRGGYGEPYWTSEPNFPDSIFYAISFIEDFEELGITLPLYVQHGLINNMSSTVVEYNNFVYYFSTDYIAPGIEWDFLISMIAIIILIVILYVVLRKFLYPVLLMKQRVYEFESGDLDSKIPITGDDELASLAKSVNKMTDNIKILLNQKQMLLLDVSHELRTPLARMQLLIEMMPDHKNINKLKQEIALLEGIISNLLLSDKLSTPYQDLQLSDIALPRLMQKVKKMFPDSKNEIKIIGDIPDIILNVDELKMILAIRNLLDNAVKYSKQSDNPCELSFGIENSILSIFVKDFGQGIKSENISKLTDPFFREDSINNVKGFGIGLTIVKKVIESHNGQLIIQSEYGKGSTFILQIAYSNLNKEPSSG